MLHAEVRRGHLSGCYIGFDPFWFSVEAGVKVKETSLCYLMCCHFVVNVKIFL